MGLSLLNMTSAKLEKGHYPGTSEIVDPITGSLSASWDARETATIPFLLCPVPLILSITEVHLASYLSLAP